MLIAAENAVTAPGLVPAGLANLGFVDDFADIIEDFLDGPGHRHPECPRNPSQCTAMLLTEFGCVGHFPPFITKKALRAFNPEGFRLKD